MKTAVVLLLVGLVAAASATECDTLTRLKVINQWNRAYSTGSDRENFAQALWRAFFAQVPEAKEKLFANVDASDMSSAKFKANAERVLAGLDIAFSMLDQPETLKAQLDHLHNMHITKQIAEKYYNTFRTALGHVLPAQLGRCWDKEAFKACYDLIVDGIKGH